jgi:transposase
MEIRDNLTARIAEAIANGWAGDVDGLTLSRTAAEHQLDQMDQIAAHRGAAVHLGMPAFSDVAGQTVTTPAPRPAHIRPRPPSACEHLLSGVVREDKLDAQWLARLTEMGLLRASFVPPAAIRALRDYTRARTRLVQERTRCWQRLEKLLESALVKVSSVASKLTTESAKDMVRAMIAGQRDPRTLAGLARGRMKAKHDDLVEALDGMFDDHHGELAQMLLDQIAFCDARIGQLTVRITGSVAAMPEAWGIDGDGTTSPDAGTGPDAAALPAVARLAEIPGISPDLARSIIAETGLDMSRFPTAAHLVSWAGLCPSARQSGPRTRNGKKGQGNGYLRGSLGQAAIGAARTQTFLGERYHRIARRRGKAKAQVAVARSILVIIWHLLADPAARFTDLGPGYYQARTDKNRRVRNHIRQIEALLGHPITITPAAA